MYEEWLTFGTGPIGIEVGQSSLVADLLKGLGGLVVDLEDAARSPPAASTLVCARHVEVLLRVAGVSGSRRGATTRVEGDGSRKEDWGRHLGGITG